MEIEIPFDEDKLMNNKITDFAARYLYYLDDKNKPKPKGYFEHQAVFVFNILGKLSLLYVRIAVYILYRSGKRYEDMF